jgi:hypothetical protein
MWSTAQGICRHPEPLKQQYCGIRDTQAIYEKPHKNRVKNYFSKNGKFC